MDNKKVSNLFRSIADLMDEATQVAVEINKEVINTAQRTAMDSPASFDFLQHSLKLMKRIEENDKVAAYKNKLTKQNKDLSEALKEIQKLREKALSDLVTESMDLSKSPIENWQKTMVDVGQHIKKEVEILGEVTGK